MKQPPYLQAGDEVIIIAPSRQIEEPQIQRALQVFSEWQLKVMLAPHLFNKDGYFAGTDQERLADLQFAFDHPTAKAIIAARGGYGMSRIVDELDLKEFIENPKWLVGFSDITALHLKLAPYKSVSIHGIMPVQFGYEGVEDSCESLYQLLFNGTVNYKFDSHPGNIHGVVTAPIIGGNLSLLVDSLATPTEIDTRGKILFVEEIDEYYYKIDRMFNQLKRAGKFDEIKGLIVGQFTDIKDTQIKFGKSIIDIICRYLPSQPIPVAFRIPVGHEAVHWAIPFGKPLTMKVNENEVILLG